MDSPKDDASGLGRHRDKPVGRPGHTKQQQGDYERGESPVSPPAIENANGADVLVNRTTFIGRNSPNGQLEVIPWQTLCEQLSLQSVQASSATFASDKRSLPLHRLARFKNNYRLGENLLEISGLEADLDNGKLELEDAADLLHAAGIEAFIHTTPSHLQIGKGSRLRVIAPLSHGYSPTMHETFMARLNGALQGNVANESFTPEQAYFFGAVRGVGYQTAQVHGQYLDLIEGLPEVGKRRPGRPPKSKARGKEVPEEEIPEGERNDTLFKEACRLRRLGGDYAYIVERLREINERRCKPPLDDGEVCTIARSATKYEQEGHALEIDINDLLYWADRNAYWNLVTGAAWGADTVDACCPKVTVGKDDNGKTKRIPASACVRNTRRIECITWHPSEPRIIRGRIVSDGGWEENPTYTTLNTFKAPPKLDGDSNLAMPWIEHVCRLYPEDAKHIVQWFAHVLQHTGKKINHCIVLAGGQGIGKDTLIAPLIAGVGDWNCKDINPGDLLSNFNGYVKTLVLRINEVQNHGNDLNRFKFYEATKTMFVTPPDVLKVNEKYMPEVKVFNVLNCIMTTNHAIDGLYLPADDRRHYVAASDVTKDQLGGTEYFRNLWTFLATGGLGHVCAYLREVDLSDFDPKAEPRKTAAFWRIVQSAGDPVEAELADAINRLGNPSVLTLDDIRRAAPNAQQQLEVSELVLVLNDLKRRRSLPSMLQRVGYVTIDNPDVKDKQWVVAGKRVAVYAKYDLTRAAQLTAARELVRGRA
jgi:hypothetical protein